ncbi:hypothetical protein CSC94_10215 [Zhengella mangrovi]|uniref:Response regulatory domain-containing protein n=1 Tax=Zhengella mangrovi TaxID=1982044 RepID=A0A2G1QPL5_9HYPH|nr:response regulator [Zhengella mangrovi]PHP67400.1 hypothetical protein CSC94_10215 [Zhengella mangrovi]
MLVEDEMLIAMDLQFTLEEAGYQVEGPFASLDTAMKADLASVDIAILDVQLQAETVFPLADRLAGNKIPFIFHSGHFDKYEAMDRYPHCGLIAKPSTPNEIIRTIERRLEPSE